LLKNARIAKNKGIMLQDINIKTPLPDGVASKVNAGGKLLIGVSYTGCDTANRRLVEAIERGEGFSFDMEESGDLLRRAQFAQT